MEVWCKALDWSKAKNIFIITFLLLNILLGYQIYIKQIGYTHNLEWTSSNMDELNELLRQQNLKLNVEIPKDLPQMHFLQVKNIIVSKNQEAEIEAGYLLNKEELEVKIKELVHSFNQYDYNQIESSGLDHLVYYQEKNGFPFFGAKLIIDIIEENKVSYTQNYYEVISQGLDRQVISSHSALRTVLDQQLIPKDAVIEQITLGYHGQTNQSTIQVLTPVWRITYSSEEQLEDIYVNAMSGGLQNITNF